MKIAVRSCLAIMGFALVAILVLSCNQNKTDPSHNHDSMYECKDGKCYPKKKPELQLGK